MNQYDPRTRRLLRKAKQTADQNKRVAATQLYQEIIDENPSLADAWVGLAKLQTQESEQTRMLEHALTLAPENEEATTALARLRGEIIEPEPIEEPVVETSGLADADIASQPDARDWSAPAVVDERFDGVKAAPDEIIEDHAAVVVEGDDSVGLRCYRCGKAIDMHNSKLTPVGYLCKDCVRSAEDTFYTATALDYVLALVVAAPLGAIAAYLATFLQIGFFAVIIMMFVAPTAGTFIARAVLYALKRRRGRYLPWLVGACIALPAVLFALISLLSASLFGTIIMALYIFFSTSAAFYHLR